MKGQILDVYPEDKKTFRACVLDWSDDYIKVVNLDDGKTYTVEPHECEKYLIHNVFALNGLTYDKED